MKIWKLQYRVITPVDFKSLGKGGTRWGEMSQCHKCKRKTSRLTSLKKYSVVDEIKDWQGEVVDTVKECRYYCSNHKE